MPSVSCTQQQGHATHPWRHLIYGMVRCPGHAFDHFGEEPFCRSELRQWTTGQEIEREAPK